MKYRVMLKYRDIIRDIIVEANSKEEAAEQVEGEINKGEKINSIKPVTSESKSGSWWEIWLD
ncbi:MAG: hypothetical protein O4861_09805 [Trichodesmium sp. St16_bin4-tuft]|uniref:hypothetical protein n=1 Tax=Trichodesmium erythraeum TaxID=1206 RepID=UPI0000392105|nr:hypothetical protein [Trichodesmium erythraeum GBRTRLIN201]MCH2050344.1 hypothetical protein [Trichodesmium sp. ALOHA_ZT_67]MCL2930275.1 hypothetical protein [Trichodesmium sp. MAG_R01]MDE5069050.1 hypothetical protein [Trichodesmium sp. St4_bin8_1]MDE5071699.1 hypothetical protein [Trichodesmium sp. St5_bin8]MDE5091417.1 hypothetical protein [Trichodesmium sp. St18_bin3_1_1]MDE5095598.1 hypothetical protein [Trichodesmium sp. St11_bin5]MDE5098614.1 hypothetical protein [Trichodesmium sp.